MEKNQEILNELKEISPALIALQGINVFTVPQGYFDTFPDQVQEAIGSGTLASLKSPFKNAMQVPAGYFENLSGSVMSRIRAAEAEDADKDFVLSIPASVKEKNVFTVPAGYFDGLPAAILGKINNQQHGRVVPLFRRPVMRYAVAAMVAALLLVAVFFTVGDFREQNSFAVVNKKTVPDPAALKYNSEKAFEKGIASLSDEQIIAYLENHGTILDNEQLIKNTDFSAMPDPLDYLENEDVLNEFLQTISKDGSIKNN